MNLEKNVRARGAITLYLGTDDTANKTTLGGEDLYSDLPEKIADIKNLNCHLFEFYQKLGYTIVVVIPNANGLGKPDIYMAKRPAPYMLTPEVTVTSKVTVTCATVISP